MKFIRVAKVQVSLPRYVEDFAAQYDCIRLSSLKGCGSIMPILHISGRGKTAWALPLPKIFARSQMAPAMAHFMTFATDSIISFS